MADNSLQQRSMRKAVERVDIGIFGAPLRLAKWVRSSKTSWSGFFVMTAGQMAIGGIMATLVGLMFGVSFNTFTAVLLVAYMLGCAIGGPFSFFVWSVVLIGITGVLSGSIAGAWVASPTWWRTLSSEWTGGKPLPTWFAIAVPAWIVFWVAASRGVSKVMMLMLERFALRLGFRAASKFSGEDKRVYDEAFRQSDISEAETRSLLENNGDGTHAVIAGKPPMVDPRPVQSADVEMGGDPDTESTVSLSKDDDIDYHRHLDLGGDDPDVQRAIGVVKPIVRPVDAVDEPVQVPVDAAGNPEGMVVEMEAPKLPDVPRDNAPAIQRVSVPTFDARSNRALYRRMTQVLAGFNGARREDRDSEFIEENMEELASTSDEQRMILDSLADSGPLLAVIKEIQEQRFDAFLTHRTDPAVPEGTGALAPDELSAVTPVADVAADAASFDEAVVDDGDVVDGTQAPETPAVVEEDVLPGAFDISSMADALASVLDDRRTIAVPTLDSEPDEEVDEQAEAVIDAPAPSSFDMSDDETHDAEIAPAAAPDRHDVDVASGDDAALFDEDAARSDVVADVPDDGAVAQPSTGMDPVVSLSKDEGDPTDHVVDVDVSADEATASDVVASVEDATSEHHDDLDAPSQGEPEIEVAPSADETAADAGDAPNAASKEDGSAVEDVQIQADDGQVEEEMSNRVFNRSVCRQVVGLVTGPLDPSEKASDIREFERNNPDISMREVLNSRSFDEHVGTVESAAARHAWTEVQHFLSQSSSERLVFDFERVNARGQQMVEVTHMLTLASFYAFETDSLRLREEAASSDNVFPRLDLVSENVGLLDRLKDTLKARAEAASNPSRGLGGLVRQRVPSEQEVLAAERGKTMIGSVLSQARGGVLGLRRPSPPIVVIDAVASEPAPVEQSVDIEAPLVLEAPESFSPTTPTSADPVVEEASEDHTMNEPVESVSVPAALRPGDDGFVSLHPVDSVDYQMEMAMHATGVDIREKALQAVRDKEDADQLAKDTAERDLREKNDDDLRRAREKTEADEAAAAKVIADRAAADDQLQKVALEEAEQRLARERADRETAEMLLAREKAANARSLEDQVVLKEFHNRQNDMVIPERFKTEDVIKNVIELGQLSTMRTTLRRIALKTNSGRGAAGMSDVEMVLRMPVTRGLFTVDLEVLGFAGSIISAIMDKLDLNDTDDEAAIKASLNEEEAKFYGQIKGQLDRARSSVSLLEKADEADAALRAEAAKAANVGVIQDRLATVESELLSSTSDLATVRAEAAAATERAVASEAERDRLALQLKAILNEQSGIVDDDFQSILDSSATKIAVGLDGFYAFKSESGSDLVIVMTTPASVFTDGTLVKNGKSVPLAEIIEMAANRSRDVYTELTAVFYTDTKLRAYVVDMSGISVNPISRRREDLITKLGEYHIKIED